MNENIFDPLFGLGVLSIARERYAEAEKCLLRAGLKVLMAYLFVAFDVRLS